MVPWLCSFAELSSDVLTLRADSELMLEALDTPRVDGGVDGAEGMVRGVVEGGGGVGSLDSANGTATFTSSRLESLLLLLGGSELFRKSKSMSSSTSCSFLGLTKPDETLVELGALLLEPDERAAMLEVPASRVALDLLMLPAAAEM